MLLPSEALGREFVFADQPGSGQSDRGGDFTTISSHAVVVGNIGLLLPVAEVSELVDGLSVCKLPNTPSWFEGITSVRGNVTPVFDLHVLFGANHDGGVRRLIVIGTNETAAAFWVDEMPRMVTLTSENSMASPPPLPDQIKNHSRDYFLKDNQIWIDWDVQEFFTAMGGQL